MFTGIPRLTGITGHVGIPAAAIVLLSGPALLGAGVATADPNGDKHFLDLLADQGIPAMEGVPSLVDTAHQVCHALDSGMSAHHVVDALVDYAVTNDPSQREIAPGRLARTEARFVIAAVGAYCPHNREKLNSLVTRADPPTAGWVTPTHPDSTDIRLVGFHGGGAALTSLIGAMPPAGIADPKPPNLPEPPSVAHLEAPPLPVVKPPRPQQPPLPQQEPPRSQQIPAPAQAPAPKPAEQAPKPAEQLPAPPPEQLPPPPAPAPPPPPPPPSTPPKAPGYVKLAP